MCYKDIKPKMDDFKNIWIKKDHTQILSILNFLRNPVKIWTFCTKSLNA